MGILRNTFRRFRRPSEDEAAAIAAALSLYRESVSASSGVRAAEEQLRGRVTLPRNLGDPSLHDIESYIITIRRK